MITSTSNNRVKQLIQLKQKAKVRKEQELFCVEGSKMFLEAPKNWIREVYISESFYVNCNYKGKLAEMQYEIVSNEVFQKISDTVTPQGVFCVLKQPKYEIEQMLLQENPLLVMLEDLQDPGNLGTIIRTGEGAGITGIIMSRNTVDVFNPKTIRATMGSIYRVPFCYIEDIVEILPRLKEKQIVTYAAHLKGNKAYTQENLCKGSAFFIGNEGNGLSEKLVGKADALIKIPMHGKVESLNAAIATTLLMYEADRQRRERQG